MRRTFKQRLTTSALGLLVALAPSLSLAAPACGSVFQQLSSYRLLPESFLRFPKAFFPTGKDFSVKTSTVKSEERLSTPEGELNIFERTGNSWSTSFAPDNMNFQGDPRWFPATVGSKVAAEFGFFMMTDRKILTPTAGYANAAITRINAKLNSSLQIEFRFRETGTEPFEGIAYLKDFLNRTLPIAESGHFAVHDLSYHFAAVLYPPHVLTHADARINLTLRLQAWEKLNESAVGVSVLKWAVEKEVERRVMLIDSSSGSLGYTLAGLKVEGADHMLPLIQQHVLGTLFTNDRTAVQEVHSNIEQRIQRLNNITEERKIGALKLLKEFMGEVKETEFHKSVHIEAKDFLAEVQARIQAINAALL